MRTLDQTIARLPSPRVPRLEAPAYAFRAGGAGLGLSPADQASHMTDESHQLFLGLGAAGYTLAGRGMAVDETDVARLLDRFGPSTVVVQDRREWLGRTADRRQDPAIRFRNTRALAARPDVFTVTVLKDAQGDGLLHRESAQDMGVHAWIVYYHPAIVCHLAPCLRPGHLVRTWHTVDADAVPPYSPDGRRGCLLSGALGPAYPLRQALVAGRRLLPETTWLPHPGYHRRGSATPEFLRTLSRYRVAVCTSSRYGYALRKLIEATACGCVVVTDLPSDEVLPEVDGNLVRIDPGTPPAEVGRLVRRLLADYDAGRQAEYARRALAWYDYRAMGLRLAADVEALRLCYGRQP